MKKRISNQKGLWINPRSKNWWFRRTVPNEIRDKVGKTMVKFSLQTSDLRIAEELACRWWAQTNLEFQNFRRGEVAVFVPSGINVSRTATNEDLIGIAKDWRTKYLKASEITGEFETDHGRSREDILNHISSLVTQGGDWVRSENFGYMRLIATDVLKHHEPTLLVDNETLDLLTRMIIEAELDVIGFKAAPFFGNIPNIASLNRDPMDTIVQRLNISQLLEDYLEDRKPPSQTEAEWRLYFRRLIETISDKKIADVQKIDIRQFRQSMERFPSSLPKKLRHRPVNELIGYAVENDLKCLSRETVQKHINAISSVFSWAVKIDLLPFNPASGQGPRRQVRERPRYPFSSEDREAIFSPEKYSEFAADPLCFWAPLIALYSGARREEIAQLHINDIILDSNIWCFSIRPVDGDAAKSVKTQSSIRRVPIHKTLVEIGFLDFVSERKVSEQQFLFGNLKRSVHNKLSTQFGKSFSRYLRETVGITSPTLVFHSFRHTFKDAARNADMSVENSDRLTGHANQSVGSRYGTGPDMAKLSRELDLIGYSSVPSFTWAEFKVRYQSIN